MDNDVVCYFTTYDSYGNRAGSVDARGGFSVIASKPGEQSIEISGTAEYNPKFINRYIIRFRIEKSGTWQISGAYLGASRIVHHIGHNITWPI